MNTIQQFIVRNIFAWNLLVEQTRHKYHDMKIQYPAIMPLCSIVEFALSCVRDMVEFAYNAVAFVHHSIRYELTEPILKPWVCISAYSCGNIHEEYYTDFDCQLTMAQNSELEYTQYDFKYAAYRLCKRVVSLIAPIHEETLLTVCFPDGYKYNRIITRENCERSDLNLTCEVSHAEIFGIEYISKLGGRGDSSSELLEISIPREEMLVGNELLSKSYILRYLMTNVYGGSCYFASDYIVRVYCIYNDNMDVVELTPNKYIVLEKNSLIVRAS